MRHTPVSLPLKAVQRALARILATLPMLPLLAALPLHAAAPACQIVIGSCHRPPLSNPAGTGILDHLVTQAFRRIGLAACIEQLPCERSLRNADAGVSDGDLLRIPTAIAEHFPNLIVVPEVLYALPISGFATRPDLQVKNLDDLAPLRVGHIIGWKILEDRVRAADILRVRGPEELLPLLADRKADIVIYERITGLHLIQALGLKGIHVLDPPLLVTPQYLMLNRRHADLAAPLAAALRALKDDGTYAAAFRAAGQTAPATK